MRTRNHPRLNQTPVATRKQKSRDLVHHRQPRPMTPLRMQRSYHFPQHPRPPRRRLQIKYQRNHQRPTRQPTRKLRNQMRLAKSRTRRRHHQRWSHHPTPILRNSTPQDPQSLHLKCLTSIPSLRPSPTRWTHKNVICERVSHTHESRTRKCVVRHHRHSRPKRKV